MNGLVIIGHGSPNEGANDALAAVTQLVRGHLQGWAVSHAYLRFGTPDIEGAVISCIHDGATTVLVHPYLLTTGGHLVNDIPIAVERLRNRFPGVTFLVTPPLGVHEKIVDVILDRVGETLPPQAEP